MDEGINRWSQLVRTPGAVEVIGHHPTLVPPKGEMLTPENGRAGVRLLVYPAAAHPQVATVDVTSTAAIAMLDGFLANGMHVGKRISFRSRGWGKTRRDTISIGPVIR